jgi:hypothetical protein
LFTGAGVKDLEIVILLHGLLRTTRSMWRMEQGLQKKGYLTLNIGYPSRRHSINYLSDRVLTEAVGRCQKTTTGTIHFVTHSMGGILVRHYLAKNILNTLGRVVMLAPPNHGSEIVDRLGAKWWFRFINGPAGCSLGTGPDSVPCSLGPVHFPLGIIGGDCSPDPIFSRMLPPPNDGKVSLASARVDGMHDFKVVPYGHTFVMNRREVIEQTAFFLKHGKFV